MTNLFARRIVALVCLDLAVFGMSSPRIEIKPARFRAETYS